MALFSRSLKPDSDADANAAGGNAAGAEGSPRHTIGELLRDTRKSYGGDIDRIAGMLRLRASYLTAIEQGQYDKLPGSVYAQGFVRAYAVHLGLDGDEAVRRFKQEVTGLEASRDLSFPMPLAERSIPGGTMVLVALILALCGYGLWYYVSTSDRSQPERVTAVPPDLVAATRPPPAAPPPVATVPDPAGASAQPGASTSSAPAPAAVPSAVVPPTTLAAPSETNPTTPIASPVAAATPAPAPSAVSTQAAPPRLTAPAAPQTAAAPAAVGSAPAASDLNPASPGAPPRVYGAPPDTPARIIVHAIKDSWVQLRNADDEVLVQRTLHPGDSVRVPDMTGLSLRTGNGAGIQFEVDGKLGRPLSGTVRTVALDADRLSANGGRVPSPRADSSPRDE